ncbi:MAG: hypothetical protein V4525_05915 [Pseudomonadota bacterium]
MKSFELSKNHMLMVMGSLAIINIAIRYNDYLGYTDIRWFLLIAQKFIEGGHYGKDFYEFNTPLSFLIYLPALLLSKIFLSDPLGWIGLFYSAFVLFCLNKTLLIFQEYNSISNPKEKNILLFLLFILFVIFPDSSVFAQRDVIVFLACLPYLTQRIQSPHSPCNYLFLLALFSIWIKPYVAIALVAIWVISNIIYKVPIKKKEIFLLSITILSYCIFIQLFFEEWWHIIYVTSQSYYAYNASLEQLFFKYLPLTCLLMLVTTLSKKHLPFVIIAAVFGVNAFIQKKPFSYYSFGAEALIISILLFILIKKWHQSLQFLFCMMLSLALLAFQFHLKKADLLEYNQNYSKIENIFNHHLKAKESVFIFSLNMDTFQVLIKNNITTASRYLFMWPLKPFLEKNHFSSEYINTQLSELSFNINEDIKQKKPTIIMIPYFFVNTNYANFLYQNSLKINCLTTENIEKCENFYRLINTMKLINLPSIISSYYTLKYTIEYPEKTNIMAVYIRN